MSDPALVYEILSQIIVAGKRINRRFSSIKTPDDFLESEEGIDKLDAICIQNTRSYPGDSVNATGI